MRRLLGLAAGYAALVGIAWCRFGRARPRRAGSDLLLGRFMPDYDVAEQHFAYIEAPPDVALRAAEETDLGGAPIIRAIFRAREIILGAVPDDVSRPKGLLPLTTSIGWGVLAERSARAMAPAAIAGGA